MEALTQMTEDQIRERIAESGKMTVKEIVNYFSRWKGQFDTKVLRSNAKEMIAEAKKYM